MIDFILRETLSDGLYTQGNRGNNKRRSLCGARRVWHQEWQWQFWHQQVWLFQRWFYNQVSPPGKMFGWRSTRLFTRGTNLQSGAPTTSPCSRWPSLLSPSTSTSTLSCSSWRRRSIWRSSLQPVSHQRMLTTLGKVPEYMVSLMSFDKWDKPEFRALF